MDRHNLHTSVSISTVRLSSAPGGGAPAGQRGGTASAKKPHRCGRIGKYAEMELQMIVRVHFMPHCGLADRAGGRRCSGTAQQATNQAEQLKQRELSAPDPDQELAQLAAQRNPGEEAAARCRLHHNPGSAEKHAARRCRRSTADQGMADERQPAGRAPAEGRRGGSRRLPAAGPRPAQHAARRRPAEGGQLQRQPARVRLAQLRQGIARCAARCAATAGRSRPSPPTRRAT